MKKIIIMLLTVVLCCSFSPVYVKAVPTNATTLITSENNPELWERFVKYDLRITDYDSLSDEEKSLCKFIFETERSSEDTIICERARRILAGYDVGERVTLDKINCYYNIADDFHSYFIPMSEDKYIEIYKPFKDEAVLQAVPDIRHIDDDKWYDEFWLDNDGNERIEVYNSTFYNEEKPFIYKKYCNEQYEIIDEIERNTEPLPTIEYENCTYQVYPDNTLALYKFNNSEIDIPDTINGMKVTRIKMYAFEKSDIKSIHLPETIKYIEPLSFYYCEDLHNINFPDGLNIIGESAFSHCTSLGNIIINGENVKLSRSPFFECSAENIIINTKVIPNTFFQYFQNFETFTIGNNVKEIGCSLLERNDIEIPLTVKIVTWESVSENGITVPKNIEILGAYNEAKGSTLLSSFGSEAEIPLLENKSMTEESNSTIRGYYGTEAHNYALAHNSKFIPLDDILYGDTNKDEKINIADLVLLQDYLLHNSTIDYEADMNKDGRINVFDLISMKEYIKKI